MSGGSSWTFRGRRGLPTSLYGSRCRMVRDIKGFCAEQLLLCTAPVSSTGTTELIVLSQIGDPMERSADKIKRSFESFPARTYISRCRQTHGMTFPPIKILCDSAKPNMSFFFLFLTSSRYRCYALVAGGCRTLTVKGQQEPLCLLEWLEFLRPVLGLQDEQDQGVEPALPVYWKYRPSHRGRERLLPRP